MTRVILLKELKTFTKNEVKDIILPVRRHKEDKEPPKDRAAEVYLMRLPDFDSVTSKAPYILHQVVTGRDTVETVNARPGMNGIRDLVARTIVRSVFCVYNKDEQAGGMELLNLMEQFRIALLKTCVVGGQFTLDLEEGLEIMTYPENGERRNAPYYLGEMVSIWKMKPVYRADAAQLARGDRFPT